MAFDGIVVANLVHELQTQLLNGRIAKIAQPETDELLLTIKASSGVKRFPAAGLSDENQQARTHDRP